MFSPPTLSDKQKKHQTFFNFDGWPGEFLFLADVDLILPYMSAICGAVMSAEENCRWTLLDRQKYTFCDDVSPS